MKEYAIYIPAIVCIIGALIHLFMPDSPQLSGRVRELGKIMFGVGLFFWLWGGAK